VLLTHRTLGKPTRSMFALLFALLLVALQQEAGWHALSHLPASLGEPVKQGLQAPGEPCLECSLLASAADFVGSAATPLLPLAKLNSVPSLPPRTRPATSAVHYRSRAPPTFA